MTRHYSLVVFSIIALLCSFDAKAQLENNYWFFGNSTAGVFFDPNNNFTPAPNNVQYRPFGGEGCGVVTDPVTGQLLFYSDGERVLNRNNVPMPNGTTLGGCSSSAQAVAFSPVPGFCDRYYIFSNTSGSGCPTKELRWSIVNMSLNGGLGDVEVATKNTLIRSDANEGMIIVQRPGFKEYWLIGKMTNNTTFYVYHITAGGITLANQFVGYAAFNYNMNYSEAAGKIAVCYPGGPVITYNFNSNTGVLSNQVQVGSVTNAYDAEFSPDGTKLYYSGWNNLSIYQYDFNTSVATLLFSNGQRGGGLRTGPDGKIYHINDRGATTLGVISNPNAAGAACNYNATGINLGVAIGGLNLPEVLAGVIPDVTSGINAGTINDVTCYGLNNGKAWASASNGQAPYTYEWSDGTLGDTLSNAAPGTYYITVTDNVRCKVRDTVVITEPTILTLATQITHVPCFGDNTGSINLQAAGGVMPYNALWNNSDTSFVAQNLSAGTYNVTVTDDNGCTATATNLTVNQSPQITLTETHTNVSCNGNADGTITLTTGGGQPAYTYSWSDNVSTQNRTALAAGIYTVTLYDSYQCSATLSVTIAEPPILAITNTFTNVSCFGGSNGSISTTTSGGTPPYSYLWNSGALTANRTGLVAGTYSVTVTDANGCTNNTSATISQPSAALNITHTVTDATCNGRPDGAINLTISGGTAPYDYIWNNGDTTEYISGIAAGTYQPTVTDANGCTATTNITVGQPDLLEITLQTTAIACHGDATANITSTVTGGTPNYIYDWSTSDISSGLSGMPAGQYIVTVTDAYQCTDTATITVGQPDLLEVTLQTTAIACHGDATANITSTVTGGTPNYTYVWNTTGTSSGLSGMPAGQYDVTVTDAQQCTDTATITVGQPDAIGFDAVVTPVSCFSFDDGLLNLSTYGGTGSIVASWVNGEYPDNSFTGLAPGNYTLLLTDDNGCDTSFTIDVTEPDPIYADILPVDDLRLGQSDTIMIMEQVNPGTTTYLWEPSTGLSCTDCSNPVVEVYSNTHYTLTIDNNGCITTDSVTVYIRPDKIIYLPNAFSPNGDNVNDVLYVYAKGVKSIKWSVYDRWGEVVFTSDDINKGWDGSKNGTLLSPGVFIIDVYIEFLDYTAQRKRQSVTLLR